jgi:signal transduction histidine kinase
MTPTRLVLSLLLAAASSVRAAEHSPVTATVLWERGYLHVTAAEMTGDSTDELVIVENDAFLEPRSQNLKAVGGTRQVASGTFDWRSSAGAYGPDRVWATFVRHDSLFCYDAWPRREVFIVRGEDVADPPGWDGAGDVVRMEDLDGDGDADALAIFGASWDMKPRGLTAVDWATGTPLWSFRFGPIAGRNEVSVVDIDGDGRKEVLLGSFAAGNGNIDNGSDDLHTYVFLLEGSGQLRWRTPIGRFSSFVRTFVVKDPRTARPLIVAGEIGNLAGGRRTDSLFLLEPDRGRIVARVQPGGLTGGIAVAADDRDNAVIAVGGADDTLRLFDLGLRPIRKAALQATGAGHIRAGRFTGSRRMELAVLTTSGFLKLYDLQLKEISSIYVGNLWDMYHVRNVGGDRLLISRYGRGELDKPVWSLIEFRASTTSSAVPLNAVLGGAASLLLLIMATLALVRYQHTRDIRATVRSLTGRAGVVELNRRGAVTSMNARAREALGAVKDAGGLPASGPLAPLAEMVGNVLAEPGEVAPKEVVVTTAPGETKLVRCVKVKTGAVLTIEDISAVEYLQRVKAWAPVAQKLAHGIKNPLGTIMGAVEQIETKVEDDRVKKYVGYVKDEVARLKKMADAFMRFTRLNPPALQPKNVNELVCKVVARCQDLGHNPDSSAESGYVPRLVAKGISLELNLDDKLPLVSLDEEGISNVLDIVVENAVEAMPAAVDGRRQTADRVLRIRTSVSNDAASAGHGESGDSPSEREDARYSPRFRGALGDLGGSFVRIEVVDTGRGIPAKYLDKVFEPYFTHGKPDGTGLGLALAKKIVEDHKGRIDIESKEGVGTTVTICLPTGG